MAKFSTKNEGTWFYFDPDNKDEGGVCLRETTLDKYNDIESVTTTHNKKVLGGILVDDAVVDERLASKMRWDYCIVDWKNVVVDGEDLSSKCTADNKLKLMLHDVSFGKFVRESMVVLSNTNKSIQEARVKNFENMPSGNPVE